MTPAPRAAPAGPDPKKTGGTKMSPPPAKTAKHSAAALREKGQNLAGKGNAALDRAKATRAGTFWTQLNTVDFINSAFQFATFGLLCIFPLLIVLTAALGGSTTKVIAVRLGLSPQAAKDVNALISTGHQALTGLTIPGIVFLALSAIGISTTVQAWYQKIYDQPAPRNAMRLLYSRAVWVLGFGAYIWLQVQIGSQVGPAGRHVLTYLVLFVLAVFFWWWTVHILLMGTMGWRALFPAGLATAFCYTGLGVFSALFFSNSIISDENSYGPVGVVMILLSYMIAIGVVVHLGAVVGRRWNDRHPATQPVAPGKTEPAR
jgi:membrane protein